MSKKSDFNLEIFGGSSEEEVMNKLSLMDVAKATKKKKERNDFSVKKLKKGMTLNLSPIQNGSPTISSKEAQKQKEEHQNLFKITKGQSYQSNTESRKYSTVDFGLLSMYTDPKADNAISPELSLKDDTAANLSSKLLDFMGSSNTSGDPNNSSEKPVVHQFAVKSDINVKGLERGKKEKVEIAGTHKKAYQMEDESICLYPFDNNMEMAMFGVLDGHSGKNAARAAKDIVPNQFSAVWQAHAPDADIKKSLLGIPTSQIQNLSEIFAHVFERVDYQMSEFQYEGCTATIAVVWSANNKRFLQVANVGDSTAFFSKGEGHETLWMSKDHKVKSPEEFARLKKLGLDISDGATRLNGLSICRTLGDCFLKGDGTGVIAEPYVSAPIELDSQGGTLIIASDGLWDVISGKHAMDIIRDEKTAEGKANKLLQTAVTSVKCQDNVTVVVVIL